MWRDRNPPWLRIRSASRWLQNWWLLDPPKSRGQVLVDVDQLLQAVHLHELVDVLVGIGIRGRILILHLGHQQGQKVVG